MIPHELQAAHKLLVGQWMTVKDLARCLGCSVPTANNRLIRLLQYKVKFKEREIRNGRQGRPSMAYRIVK